MNWFEREIRQVVETEPVQVVTVGGFTVNYIKPEVMKRNGSFGYLYKGDIYIRAGLPKRVEKFVINHEIYHIVDRWQWWGWVGRELRANFICGIKDPLGLTLTIIYSINKERLKAYWYSLKNVNFKQV